MISDYKSKNKITGNLYIEFNNVYKLPYNFFRMIELCPQLNFYYTNIEKEEYLEKWRNRITNNYVSFNKMEYDLYVKITEENQINYKRMDNHYSDTGCTCNMCSEKRQQLLFDVTNGFRNINDVSIIHKFDDTYSSYVSFSMNGNIVSLNVVNY